VLIDADDPEAAEYQTVSTITPPGIPAEPARLTLEVPLARAHAQGCRVARMNPGALPPPTRTLASPAERGDRCLFLDAPLGSPPATLRITGGTDEFQAFAPLSVQTDADGYFRFPPLHRMARIALTVDDGGGNVLPPIEVDPDYGEAEQRVDAVYLV
jgi:FAD/FMN-containing dehydrogenase